MAQIIVLTVEAKRVLQRMVFLRINEIGDGANEAVAGETDVLHKIYSDIVNKK